MTRVTLLDTSPADVTAATLLLQQRRISHYRPPQALDQVGQAQQILDPETTATGRDNLKRVRRSSTGPPCGQVPQSPSVVVEVHPVFAPRLPGGDQLELLAEERMEGVRYADARSRFTRIRCSRLPSRTARRREAAGTSRTTPSRAAASTLSTSSTPSCLTGTARWRE
jgi:hypothetical protein